ncbi:MAG: CPBP family intramembrane metalloprotease [Phycisphaeraceae bacterium]|nr:CPBP family intramembrane metalloprotease [Phycisphaeraceae bacterium]
MTQAAAPSRAGVRGGAPIRGVGGYLRRSALPLGSLLFLLPLIVLYEVGTRLYAFDPVHQTEQRIIAFNLLRDFFQLVGASGRYLPALAVVGILLSWHIARNDPWRFSPSTWGLMAAESFALAAPIMLLSVAAAHYVPLSTGAGADWRTLTVLSLGAGIYEELVFRLIGFTLLSLLLLDLLRLPRTLGLIAMIVVPAVLFSLYHYLGDETPALRSFLFRTLAGLYFGVIFATSGFGITAGSHAAYDILIVLMSTWRTP